MNAILTRRAALAGALVAVPALAGAVAFAGPSAASAEPAIADPIFAAIERHRTSAAAFGATCNRIDNVLAEQEGRTVTAEDEAIYAAANADEYDALDALLETPPQTIAGARAAIEYLLAYSAGCVDDVAGRFLPALLESPVLAG